MTSRRSGITEDGEIFHLTPKFLLLHDFPALATHLAVVGDLANIKLVHDLLKRKRTKDFSTAAAEEIDGLIKARDGHGEVLLV